MKQQFGGFVRQQSRLVGHVRHRGQRVFLPGPDDELDGAAIVLELAFGGLLDLLPDPAAGHRSRDGDGHQHHREQRQDDLVRDPEIP
ncbi:MAG: hypothetical protein M1325_02730 [Actinobacteria bacterium]|nr:hypothetical protein [Actinomycetota bacterium]